MQSVGVRVAIDCSLAGALRFWGYQLRHAVAVLAIIPNTNALATDNWQWSPLPDPVLHGTMDCYSGNHLVANCQFFY
jgi:hypothetical protein